MTHRTPRMATGLRRRLLAPVHKKLLKVLRQPLELTADFATPYVRWCGLLATSWRAEWVDAARMVRRRGWIGTR